MARIHKIEPIVENVLKEKPQSRKDDFVLILEVLSTFVTPQLSLEEVFKNHIALGIPSLETITRSRRKVQERNPDLKDVETQEARNDMQQIFVDYALSDKMPY